VASIRGRIGQQREAVRVRAIGHGDAANAVQVYRCSGSPGGSIPGPSAQVVHD